MKQIYKNHINAVDIIHINKRRWRWQMSYDKRMFLHVCL